MCVTGQTPRMSKQLCGHSLPPKEEPGRRRRWGAAKRRGWPAGAPAQRRFPRSSRVPRAPAPLCPRRGRAQPAGGADTGGSARPSGSGGGRGTAPRFWAAAPAPPCPPAGAAARACPPRGWNAFPRNQLKQTSSGAAACAALPPVCSPRARGRSGRLTPRCPAAAAPPPAPRGEPGERPGERPSALPERGAAEPALISPLSRRHTGTPSETSAAGRKIDPGGEKKPVKSTSG